MPIKDDDKRRAYFSAYMARKRAAGKATWEQTLEAKAAKTEAKRRERSRKTVGQTSSSFHALKGGLGI